MESRRKPLRPAVMAAWTRAGNAARTPADDPHLLVEDHLEPRVRIPADLVRSVIAVIEIGILAGLALLANATATGVEVDLVGASGRLPAALLQLIGWAGPVALLILPIALAIRLLMVRQYRRLAEAVAAGGITVGVVALINALLNQPFLRQLQIALHTTTAGVTGRHEATLGGLLAGLVAYVTVVGLRGRAHWRTAFLTAVGFYAVARLAATQQTHTTVLSLLTRIAIGSAVGSGLRYALGTTTGRPTATEIATTLSNGQTPIVAIRRVANGSPEVRRYAATARDGALLDVTVFDRDQQAADAFYRLYRRGRRKANTSRRTAPSPAGALRTQPPLFFSTQGSCLVTPALLVGPDRAAGIAIEKVPRDGLLGLVSLLQPVALHRSTRSALRGRKNVLADVRKRLMAAAPDGEVMPARLERVRPRTLITLIAGVFAAYILAGQLANVSFSKLLAQTNPEWSLIALACSAATYVGATLAISGFVLERLNTLRTLLVHVAASFVMLVTPVAVGGVALNVRYLRKAKLSPTDAAASVGATQVMSFAVFAVLVVISAAIAGSSRAAQALTPPRWAYIALAILAGATLIVLALPAGRRQLISRVGSVASQVIPRLVDVAQRPAKLAQGAGGSVLISAAYILCLPASARAVGYTHVQLASIAVVYLAGNAAGSFIPTPGGIGAVETALSIALVGAGLTAAPAITAVLLFRTVTFWLPVLAGWVSLHYLQRRDLI